MPNILDEALAPSRDAAQKPRSKAKAGGTFADSGKLLCFVFMLPLRLGFVGVNSFLFWCAAVPYSTSAAAPGKCVASPARPHEIALSQLLDCGLVAELRLCLCCGEEEASVLTERELRFTKLANDLGALEEANACLQGEVERLKESAIEDKKVAAAAKNELATVREELEMVRAENQGLLPSLKERREPFSRRGDQISCFADPRWCLCASRRVCFAHGPGGYLSGLAQDAASCGP